MRKIEEELPPSRRPPVVTRRDVARKRLVKLNPAFN